MHYSYQFIYSDSLKSVLQNLCVMKEELQFYYYLYYVILLLIIYYLPCTDHSTLSGLPDLLM